MSDSSHPARNSGVPKVALKRFSRAHIWVYQRTNGRIGTKLLWFQGNQDAADRRIPLVVCEPIWS